MLELAKNLVHDNWVGTSLHALSDSTSIFNLVHMPWVGFRWNCIRACLDLMVLSGTQLSRWYQMMLTILLQNFPMHMHLSVDSTDRVRLAMSASGMVYSCNGSQCTFLHNLPSMNVHQAAGLLHEQCHIPQCSRYWASRGCCGLETSQLLKFTWWMLESMYSVLQRTRSGIRDSIHTTACFAAERFQHMVCKGKVKTGLLGTWWVEEQFSSQHTTRSPETYPC